MTVIRVMRYTAAPEQADEVLSRREALIKAVRANHAGLAKAQLVRIDEGSWMDIWHWDSRSAMEAATSVADQMPETRAAFALVKDPTANEGDLVAED